MIDFEKLKNPDLINEEILNIKDYIESLESKNKQLTESNATLQQTNQRLFLRVSNPQDETQVQPEKTPDEYMNELKNHFKELEGKTHGNDKR